MRAPAKTTPFMMSGIDVMYVITQELLYCIIPTYSVKKKKTMILRQNDYLYKFPIDGIAQFYILNVCFSVYVRHLNYVIHFVLEI